MPSLALSASSKRSLLTDRRTMLAAVFVAMLLTFSWLSPALVRPALLLDITKFGVVVGLLTLGQTLIILSGRGGIDLSVGSTLSLAGIVMGLAVEAGVPVWPAAGLAIVTGVVLGAVNGALIAFVGIPALIGTVGTLFLYGSLALVISGGTAVSGYGDAGFPFLGQGTVLGMPAQLILVLLPAYAVLGWLVARTRFGRTIYEVGNGDRAARLVGRSPNLLRFWLFCLSGGLAGLGAVVTNSWLQTARPAAGAGLELQAVTIAVLGGTHIFGGRGRLSGTFLALFVVILLNAGLQFNGIDQVWQSGVLGALLVGSVVLNNLLSGEGDG
jgi:ribose/xylose/arabinose/galactoside ABC-type transport system permease subunit